MRSELKLLQLKLLLNSSYGSISYESNIYEEINKIKRSIYVSKKRIHLIEKLWIN